MCAKVYKIEKAACRPYVALGRVRLVHELLRGGVYGSTLIKRKILDIGKLDFTGAAKICNFDNFVFSK